ncbi:DUF1641 domain-containing protein [Pseudomonas sp. ADAK18]|uniref:DUF1641 domain-containing protein n=1 Tax=Pseudomonas sp. ADAK18 TaxID=2730848 RepID=UPI001F3B6793|nr:DUF1641 domain-containing protein [Pseudomonas sp. ADAK18]
MDNDIALQALLNKLQPLVNSGRLDNVVDLISVTSHAIDLVDVAMVEKLAGLFDQATSVSWELGNALRMAKAQTQAQVEPHSLYGLLTLLREPDTRRGVGLVLRTLNVIGRQL